MAEQRFVLELAPVPGQIELALAQVHRRRRRSFTTAVSALTAAIVAVTFLYVRSDGAYLYRPGSPGADSVNADVTAARRPGADRRSGAATPRSLSVQGPRQTPGRTPTAGGTLPVSTEVPRHPVPPEGTSRPVMTRQVKAIGGPGADLVHVSVCVASPWCSDVHTAHGARGLVLAYDVCRSTTEAPGALRFATTQEADFAVLTPDGAVVWQWSHGQRFARAASAVPVESGTCARWVVEWDGVLDDGRPLPAGTYLVRARSASTTSVDPAEREFATEPG